jgi:N-acetyl-anhydromuramoyl-L-alanine amidase
VVIASMSLVAEGGEGIGSAPDFAPGSGLWWPDARRCPSPNRDARPAGIRPELIVVHAISLPPGEFGGSFIEQLFCNTLDPGVHPYFAEIADLRVSAHALIDRGGHATQFVPFDQRAWHAGVSCWQGRERCNDFSIGIELEGCDDRPFAAEQYRVLARMIRWLAGQYPALDRKEALVGHSDVAPGRKTDPGPHFDWRRLENCLREELLS